jgi:hypothetical protein
MHQYYFCATYTRIGRVFIRGCNGVHSTCTQYYFVLYQYLVYQYLAVLVSQRARYKEHAHSWAVSIRRFNPHNARALLSHHSVILRATSTELEREGGREGRTEVGTDGGTEEKERGREVFFFALAARLLPRQSSGGRGVSGVCCGSYGSSARVIS